MDESQARAWLCAQLPTLLRNARDGGWTATLTEAMSLLDDGGSALDVLAYLDPGALSPPGDRDGGAPFLLYGAASREVVGEYVCPDDACERRSGRDERGRPPTCELRKRPMRFVEN